MLNLDRVTCPCCGRVHWISEHFSGGLVNRYATQVYAPRERFIFVRSNRDAIEFAATRQTRWAREILAYTIGDCIFWPSRAAMRRRSILRHEQCHVRQSRRLGPMFFWVCYWLADLLRARL